MSRIFIITLITALILSATCQGTYDSDDAGGYFSSNPTNDDNCDTCQHGHIHVGHVHDHGHVHEGGFVLPYGTGGGYSNWPYSQPAGYWNWPYGQVGVPYGQAGGYWNGPNYGR